MSDLYTIGYNTLAFVAGIKIPLIPIYLRKPPSYLFAVSSISYSLPLPLAYRIGAATIGIWASTDPIVTGVKESKAHEIIAFSILGGVCTYYTSPQDRTFTLFNVAQSMLAIWLGMVASNASVRIFCKQAQIEKKH